MYKELAMAAGLSAALVAGAARADVVLYGKIYAELGNESFGSGVTEVEYSTLDDSQNLGRLGVKFSQDLGNGLTAVGKYEFSLNAPDGANNFRMRDAWVGLRGKFGQLAMGRFDGAYKVTGGINWDPFAFTSLQLASNGGQSNTNFGNAGFIDHAIEYRTPEVMDGDTLKFQGILQFAMDDTPTSTTTPKDSLLVGTTFNLGGIEFIYAYAANEGAGAVNQKFGAKIQAGDASFAIQSEDVEQGGYDPAGIGQYMAGIITYQVGNALFVAEIGEYNSEYDGTLTPLDLTDDAGAGASCATLGLRYYLARNVWLNFGSRTTHSEIPAFDSSATVVGMRFDF